MANLTSKSKLDIINKSILYNDNEKSLDLLNKNNNSNIRLDEDMAIYNQLKLGSIYSDTPSPIISLNSSANTLTSLSLNGQLISSNIIENKKLFTINLFDYNEKYMTSCFDIHSNQGNEYSCVGLTNGISIITDIYKSKRLYQFNDSKVKISGIAMPIFNMLYTSSYDGVFQVRNLSIDAIQHFYECGDTPISHMKVLNNADEILISTLNGNINMLDLRKRDCAFTFDIDTKNTPVRYFDINKNDSNIIYISYGNGNLACKDLRNPSVNLFNITRAHSEVINALIHDSVKNHLITGGDDSKCKIYESTSGNLLDTIETKFPVSSLAQINGQLYTGEIGNKITNYDLNSIFQIKQTMETKKLEIEMEKAHVESNDDQDDDDEPKDKSADDSNAKVPSARGQDKSDKADSDDKSDKKEKKAKKKGKKKK